MFKAVKNTKNWKSSLIYEQATVRDAIQNLDNSKLQIILVVKDGDFLVGTITDGDIRRGLLQGLTLADKVSSITKKDSISIFEGTQVELVNQIMKVNKVQKIPIIDSKSRVVGLYEKDEKDEKDDIEIVMNNCCKCGQDPYFCQCNEIIKLMYSKFNQFNPEKDTY